MLTSIVAAIVILGLLIVVHELGHFVMAKQLGVRVLRFSIGYPPRIWGIRRGETEYVIGATPFGGYVRMLGDEIGGTPKPEELAIYLNEIGFDLVGAAARRATIDKRAKPAEALPLLAARLANADSGSPGDAAAEGEFGRALRPEESLLLSEISSRESVEAAVKALSERAPQVLIDSFRKRSFPAQPLMNRVLIVLAGPVANLLFAPILLVALFLYGVPQLLPIIGDVKAGLPADGAGIQKGDRILSVNGVALQTWAEFSDQVKSGDGSPLKLEIQRKVDGQMLVKKLVIKPTREVQDTVYGTKVDSWIIGVTPRGDEIMRRAGPIDAIYYGTRTTVTMATQLGVGIYHIVVGDTPVRGALGGPILIAQMAGKQAQEGLANVALFTVMLSLQLGIVNLLPVPLLDGGHLLFFAFEGVRGKPLALRHREVALQVGLFLLVALMAFVIFNDITRIVQG
ncbi:MAG: RIP metalloprotease RseP [Candidatus Binataceae bacterium]